MIVHSGLGFRYVRRVRYATYDKCFVFCVILSYEYSSTSTVQVECLFIQSTIIGTAATRKTEVLFFWYKVLVPCTSTCTFQQTCDFEFCEDTCEM